MDVCINRSEKTIKWNVGSRVITIYNEHILYAFKHGKNLLMVKEKYESSESGFTLYSQDGSIVLSYQYLGNRFTFGNINIADIDGKIIAADYEEEKRRIVILKELEGTKSLFIYDEYGDFITEIVPPKGYIFVSLKNNHGNIMVVGQGISEITRDSFGRNYWSYAIDFENFYIQKKSIIQ